MTEEQINYMAEEFGKAQQELIDNFKKKMHRTCEEVLGYIYADCTQHATSDAHINYHNYLKDVFRDQIRDEVLREDLGHYSWAHSIRMELLEKHPEKLQSLIISDLQAKVKSMEETLANWRRIR